MRRIAAFAPLAFVVLAACGSSDDGGGPSVSVAPGASGGSTAAGGTSASMGGSATTGGGTSSGTGGAAGFPTGAGGSHAGTGGSHAGTGGTTSGGHAGATAGSSGAKGGSAGAPNGGAAGTTNGGSGGIVETIDDPCSAAPDGKHCGASLVPAGDSGTLYTCSGMKTSSTQVCYGGCQNDACASTSAADPCSGATSGDGQYCGSSLPGGDASAVYICMGGSTVSKVACTDGCHVSPAGTNDYCNVGATSDPCASAPSDGPYCGGDAIGGDPGTLYTCSGGKTSSMTTCSMGCQVNPQGVPDACKSAGDPCNTAPTDGDYCGGDAIGGDSSTLYHCLNKKTASSMVCSSGCQVAPQGTNDTCKGAGDPCATAPTNGKYCGGDAIGGDSNTLYACSGGTTTASTVCSAGCHVASQGTDDSCNPTGGDPCSGAASGDGPYCGGELPGGDASTLYQCAGGTTASSTPCSNGCVIAPAGSPDYCQGTGVVSCGAPQWWTLSPTYYYALTTHWANVATYWDADFGQIVDQPVQLRHDSTLLGYDPGSCCGYVPTFKDNQTGEIFRFLHLHPQQMNATNVGQTYSAGFIVGISGGDTYDTGLGKSCGANPCSTGAHLCVETADGFTTAFPAGKEACQ